MGEKIKILYIDDNPFDRELVRDALVVEHGGFVLTEVETKDRFLETLKSAVFDAVLSDFNILGYEGLDIISEVRDADPQLPVIIVTGTGSEEIAVESLKQGATDYVIKTPDHIRRLPQTIEAAIEKSRLRTLRERADKELRNQKQFLETVIDSLPHPFYVIDVKDYSIILANKTAREINNLQLPYCYSAIHGEAAPCSSKDHLCPLKTVKRTGQPTVLEHLHLDKIGNKRHFEVYAYPLFDNAGQLTRMIEMSIEITARKSAEIALQKLNDELEDIVESRTLALRKANQELLRRERLATIGQVAGAIAHDLRNPLGVINNALYYLHAVIGDQDEKVVEYFNIIQKEAKRSVEIIEELLSFSSFPVLNLQKVSLDKLLDEVIAVTMLPRSITIKKESTPGLPLRFVDKDKMIRALQNLINNSIQATDDGGEIVVGSRVADDMIEIRIIDNGPGIPEEQIEKIFEPLFTTKPKGIGLGLSSAKQIIEAHGGSLEVVSVVNQGSTFITRLAVESKKIE